MRCILQKNSAEYADYLNRAHGLAEKVNRGAANDSETPRQDERRLLDAFGGILAEEGWLQLFQKYYGPIASPTPFVSANGQIDIRLAGGQSLEVRSSFPKNGVKFAIGHDAHNFNIIGNYQNFYKPGEVPKDFYSTVLFDTKKPDLLQADTINFTLIGGATADMMRDAGQVRNLVAEGDLTNTPTEYKTLAIKHGLDMRDFAATMKTWGYQHLAAR